MSALLDEVVSDLETTEALHEAYRSEDRASCDWPDLRRAILAYGGIAPSRDYDNANWPGDLLRLRGGLPPDIVAAEAVTPAPWGNEGDPDAMLAYLQRSHGQWQRANVPARRSPKVRVEAPAVTRAAGTRSFADLVADLRRKHGAGVDLSGLRAEYVTAYETGERVDVVHEGRTLRGTVGATRGKAPRFVLLLSVDL